MLPRGGVGPQRLCPFGLVCAPPRPCPASARCPKKSRHFAAHFSAGFPRFEARLLCRSDAARRPRLLDQRTLRHSQSKYSNTQKRQSARFDESRPGWFGNRVVTDFVRRSMPYSFLHVAAMRNDVTKAEQLIDGEAPDDVHVWKGQPIESRGGDLNPIFVDERDANGWTPLMVAATHGHLAMCRCESSSSSSSSSRRREWWWRKKWGHFGCIKKVSASSQEEESITVKMSCMYTVCIRHM